MPNRPNVSTPAPAGGDEPGFWIIQGKFGRATLSVTARALVAHAHEEINLIIKLGGADARFKTGERVLELKDGMVALFGPWCSHAKLPNDTGMSLLLVLLLEPAWLAAALNVDQPALEGLFPEPLVELDPELKDHAERIAAVISRGMMASDTLCEEYVREFVVALAKAFGKPSIARGLPRGRLIDKRIRNALRFIREHAAENPNLEDVAAEVGLSRSRFFEQFRDGVGVSPQHYLDWVRMSLATQKLCATNESIADIAAALGFSEQSHFTRFFTQHLALSPTEFRRRAITIGDPSASGGDS
jgi:AraC family transcriptional regulator